LLQNLDQSNRIIKLALTSLAISLLARAFTGLAGLYVFTISMGVSIAVMNYEIPAWVKKHSQNETGLITGIYVTLMGVAGSIAIAISVPLAEMNSWVGALPCCPGLS
jgi:CP family cyanate transporter-like MFS transporter